MATQAERRAVTRARLLDAATELFAEDGVVATSVDAVAARAGRTSGAVYDHFGSKDGLLVALLDAWVDDVAAAVLAELPHAATVDDRLAVLWRNVARPVAGDGRWIPLEHELWAYGVRNDHAHEHLVRRYRHIWQEVAGVADEAAGDAIELGAAVVGVLFGLEMMRRVDPDAVPDSLAVAALRGVVATTTPRGAPVS